MVFLAGFALASLGQVAPERAWVERLLVSEGRTALTVSGVETVRNGVEVIAELQYPGMGGETVTGQVKLYLPSRLAIEPEARLPLLHVAGYEAERGMGEALAGLGMIVSTPHGEEPNPIVRGENLDVAILHRIRALPCVDDERVLIAGGSAGGYMTLMLTAETFPLAGSQPDVPPMNLGYNCGYIVVNKPLAEAQPEGQEHQNMPVLNAVAPIGEGATEVYGADYSSEAWLNASPVTRLDEITCPTLITVSTADLLVPVNQYSADLAQDFDQALFPEGFRIALADFVPRPEAQLTFLGTVPAGAVHMARLTVPADTPKLGWTGEPDGPNAAHIKVPFSQTKRFTLAVLDEGPVEPQVGHLKYFVNPDKGEFLGWAAGRGVGPEQLSPAKLRRLMRRYLGQETHPQRVTRESGEVTLNRLDFAEAERADVRRGLRTFCARDDCARRFQELYGQLPAELQALGPAIADMDLTDLRAALAD